MPSTNWLSWGKSKPSTTALSSSIKKPSAGQLPTPSATTAGASSLANAGTRPYGQTGYPLPGGQSAASGYQTGPYNTAGTTSYQPASTGLAGNAQSPHGAPSSTYQSPYQQATASNPYAGYQTADARSAGGYSAGSGAGQGASSWNSTPAGGDAYGAARASSPYGATPYGSGGYGTQPTPSGYPQSGANESSPYGASPYSGGAYNTGGGYQQPASYQQTVPTTATGTSQSWNNDAGQSGYPTASPSSYENGSAGQYRPGSTGRNAEALSPGSTSATPTSSGYPTTSGSQGYGGASAYPSTSGY